MRYKAIIQLTSGEDVIFKSLSSQIHNLINALNSEVDIELVCHGRSLPFVLKEENRWPDTILHLLKNRVEIMACENMLQANGKSKKDLFPGIKTVASAIAEIVVKQEEGWSYIKTGY